VKLPLAMGATSEGGVYSHVRRAASEAIEPTTLEQVALLAIPTLGFAPAAAAYTWIRDLEDPASDAR